MGQFARLEPEVIAFNASRCPELIMAEVRRHWSGRILSLFEERPLGTTGTLASNQALFQGTWMVCNTDFVMDIPLSGILMDHLRLRSRWTVLTTDLPRSGNYRSLSIGGTRTHYAGVSVISPEVARCAGAKGTGPGFFTGLRKAFQERGFSIHGHHSTARWHDTGETELYRRYALSRGQFVHPLAEVRAGASLEGFYLIDASCIIHGGAVVRNSVLLEGSSVLPGAVAEDAVLPWFFSKEP